MLSKDKLTKLFMTEVEQPAEPDPTNNGMDGDGVSISSYKKFQFSLLRTLITGIVTAVGAALLTWSVWITKAAIAQDSNVKNTARLEKKVVAAENKNDEAHKFIIKQVKEQNTGLSEQIKDQETEIKGSIKQQKDDLMLFLQQQNSQIIQLQKQNTDIYKVLIQMKQEKTNSSGTTTQPPR